MGKKKNRSKGSGQSSNQQPANNQQAPQNQPAINLDHLRLQLKDINESNPTELLAFKRNMERTLGLGPSNVPITPASKLTRAEIFSSFGLKNVVSSGGYSSPFVRFTGSLSLADELLMCMEFPPFTPPKESPNHSSEWLAEALNRCVDMTCQNSESHVNLLTSLMIMDVIHDLPGLGHFTRFKPGPGNTKDPLSPAGTPSSPSILYTYNNIRPSATVTVGGKPTLVTSRLDTVYTTPKLIPAANGTFIGPFLAVLEVNGVSSKLEDCDFPTATKEVTASLAILRQARTSLLQRLNLQQQRCPDYAVITNGVFHEFFFLDEEMKVHRSANFDLNFLPEVLQYFRYCFAEIRRGATTSAAG